MRLAKRFIVVFVLILLPLAGVMITGQPLARYLEFPPLTRYVQHEPFNWVVFCAGAIFFLMVMLFFAFALSRSLSWQGDSKHRRLPWWGKIGVLVVILTWVLAWSRFSWFSGLQVYTFTPLWLGYILLVNAITWKRSGTCLMTRNPGRFFLLFPVSSVFWWYFEWLNRFVQNWYYVGIEDFTGFAYVLHATVCFATVLPAVAGTTELLETVVQLREPLKNKVEQGRRPSAGIGWFLLLLMGASLAGIAIWPDYLFPLVWTSPLLIIIALQIITGRRTIISSLANGCWQPVLLPALAALICGFFWELWNWKSLAHWEYSIPFVDRLHLFAMPILGYAGYLPFGLECDVVSRQLFSGNNVISEQVEG